jgi:hypothetical protein
MSKATLLYLKERPVNSESQGSQSNPRCHNSAVPMSSLSDSAKPNVDDRSRGQVSNGSAEAPGPGIHTPSHSPAPEHPVPDEGNMPVVSSSKEHNAGVAGNEVTTL